jgi:L-fuconolactonase
MAGNTILDRPYYPADLFELAGPDIEVERIVFVQADVKPSASLDEARWVDSLAQDNPQIQAIVAWAPLEDPEAAADYLHAYQALPLVKGIRRLIQSEPVGFARQPGFVRGVQSLPDYGYSCDLCIYHPQMDDIVYLVGQCPGVQFVLDHIGKPDIKAGLLDPWSEDIEALAAYPNVWCKLSGMVTEADHEHWTAEDLRPYVDHVVECFGVERLMFGGDWPVARRASTYVRWVETLSTLTAQWSEAEKQQVFYDNAGIFYHI